MLRVVIIKPSKYGMTGYVERFRRGFMPNSTVPYIRSMTPASVDGTPIDGVESLRNALLNRPDAFVQTMTEKLLMYAVGRASHYYDMPAIRTITREAARSDYKFSSLVAGIVNSDAFQMRVKKAEDTK